MNEHLSERFGRSRNAFRPGQQQAAVLLIPPQLNPRVSEYFRPSTEQTSEAWQDLPELPSSEEVLDTELDGSSSSDKVEIQPNRVKGAWPSKETYLGAHYELLREDAIRPLREAVSHVRITSTANEDAFHGAIGIYEKVHICAMICSTRGIALRVTFSLRRTGKKIIWEQSKRLVTGGLVVLTPKDDAFKTRAIVATVAARPLAALQQNPPELDLFIAREDELEIDPAQEFLMIEDRGGLYEANRHTLLALQRMIREPFPLSEHLVNVVRSVSAPNYVQESQEFDLTSVYTNSPNHAYERVNIIRHWPDEPASNLDASQLAALRRILTKKLAIVQGPPGTGKTYVTVEAIKVMLANRSKDDPPIIIACQTNHAIDQILRHIAEFDTDFIRLGGRSKDRGIVKARTLYEIKKQTSENRVHGSAGPRARMQMRNIEKDIEVLLSPLKADKSPLDCDILHKLGLLTEKQRDSLVTGASRWVQEQLVNPNHARSPFTVWLGETTLIAVDSKQQPEDFGFDFEEADLEFEQLKELEAENVAKDDEDFESLSGNTYSIADNFTCRKPGPMSEAKLKETLRHEDMWKIPTASRPAVYRHLQAELKKIIRGALREKAKEYNAQAALLRIGKWEQDEPILKQQKIIGMTTTGLSKYRGLLAALSPKIVIIEEAAETLEAPVTVACLPTLQQLILVGDHQQLRPHCHVRAHEDKPYYLNMSLFERLVRNKIEYSVLSKQRRMIPEVRRLLNPIYGDLIEDHESVLDPIKRQDVPGMGGVNSLFFTHHWPEHRDEQMSAVNPNEADMIVAFVEYLSYNLVAIEDITILTFYNGQRKRILKLLREKVTLQNQRFNVVTVDSYQGEENKIVILSLVRSNDRAQIGFLDNRNRVCVALSRAQCGFYIFGNGQNLWQHKIWNEVITIMANKGPKQDRLKAQPKTRVEETLTIYCRNHNNKTEVTISDDLERLNGGCSLECKGIMPCGHPCELKCHPFPHDNLFCQQRCTKELPCGHACDQMCGDPCSCRICMRGRSPPKVVELPANNENASQMSNSASWNTFATTESKRYAEAAATPPPPSHYASPLKKAVTKDQLLVDLGEDREVVQSMAQMGLGFDGYMSPSASSSPSKCGSSVVLLEETMVNGGKRVKRREKFLTGGSDSFVVVVEKDWSKEPSLLD